MACLIIVICVIVLLIASILFFPSIPLGKFKISTYWVIALLGAILLMATQNVSLTSIKDSFFSDSVVNPLKILVLFISMTVLSVFLDEVGLFQYLALKASSFLKGSQFRLFIGFYVLISFLTVFTSNDIIILTFTPFICYYCKNAKINPVPFLVSEFIAANTWSMALIVGNPTNIYLASFFSIDFMTYLSQMILPTLVASLVSLALLILIFYSQLKKPMEIYESEIRKPNLFLTIVGLIHLIACIVLIAISSYVKMEMWIITISFATSLLLFALIYMLVKKEKQPYILHTLKRAPWNLIPFVLSMFIIVLSLNEQGYVAQLSSWLGTDNFFIYGLTSAVSANLINNIPMSVLFSSVLSIASTKCVYATIISSNIAAFLTPIGALAGIMWMNLLKTYDVKFSFLSFMKYGCLIGIPTLLCALSMLLI